MTDIPARAIETDDGQAPESADPLPTPLEGRCAIS